MTASWARSNCSLGGLSPWQPGPSILRWGCPAWHGHIPLFIHDRRSDARCETTRFQRHSFHSVAGGFQLHLVHFHWYSAGVIAWLYP